VPLGEEAKRFIMDEVTRQVTPMQRLLQNVQEWQLSFWSNGSGKPPGFFQNRMKTDDDRFRALKEETENQSVLLEDMKAFMTEMRTRRDERDRRDVRHRWLIGILVTIGLAIAGGIYSQFVPAIKAIMEDYYQRHPKAMIQRNSSENESNSVYAWAKNLVEHSAVE
jgi:hypothetical protein